MRGEADKKQRRVSAGGRACIGKPTNRWSGPCRRSVEDAEIPPVGWQGRDIKLGDEAAAAGMPAGRPRHDHSSRAAARKVDRAGSQGGQRYDDGVLRFTAHRAAVAADPGMAIGLRD